MLRVTTAARFPLRPAISRTLDRHFFSTRMPSSGGIISLDNIPSWYDHYQKHPSATQEDSEYAFDEKLNKRVGLIVGTPFLKSVNALPSLTTLLFQATSPNSKFAVSFIYGNTCAQRLSSRSTVSLMRRIILFLAEAESTVPYIAPLDPSC